MKLKLLFYRFRNWITKPIYIFVSYLHCRYADYLADQNGHWYHVFRIGWKFRILTVKDIDDCKRNDIRYAKRVLRIPNAKIHSSLDFQKHCIYTAKQKQISNKRIIK